MWCKTSCVFSFLKVSRLVSNLRKVSGPLSLRFQPCQRVVCWEDVSTNRKFTIPLYVISNCTFVHVTWIVRLFIDLFPWSLVLSALFCHHPFTPLSCSFYGTVLPCRFFFLKLCAWGLRGCSSAGLGFLHPWPLVQPMSEPNCLLPNKIFGKHGTHPTLDKKWCDRFSLVMLVSCELSCDVHLFPWWCIPFIYIDMRWHTACPCI